MADNFYCYCCRNAEFQPHLIQNKHIYCKYCQQHKQYIFYVCKKNILHVESNCTVQFLKYLIIIVNRCKYINNNFTKGRCSIHVDMTIVLGSHKCSLQATYHRSFRTVNIFWLLYYLKCQVLPKHPIATTANLRSVNDWYQNSSTAYKVIYELNI